MNHPAGSSQRLRYHVRHDTHYQYLHPVSESRHLLRLTPRALPWQQTLDHHLEIFPSPDARHGYQDAFGNLVTSVQYLTDHNELRVSSECWVDLGTRPAPRSEHAAQSWESVRNQLRYHASKARPRDELEATAFRFASPLVPLGREFVDYGMVSFRTCRTLMHGCQDLMERIHRDFTFDPTATDISTPVARVMRQRRGVCQDFAQVMLACLRSLGLAARYISGYLLTNPPEGQERLIGADATHAWVGVFLPGYGWMEYDPTNGVQAGDAHIVLGWGRDFQDTTPMRGVLLGGGDHQLDIAVTVVPEQEFDLIYAEGDTLLPPVEPGG